MKPAMTKLPEYTEGEEMANAVTHAVGTGLSLAGLGALVALAVLRGGDVWRTVSLSVYGATLVLTHLASTLYHGVRFARLKAFFRIVDHASIYLLIAGTYTPFLVISLRGPWGWSLLGVVWAMAITGVAFQSVFSGRLRRLSLVTYVVMGWLVVVAAGQVFQLLPLGAIALLFAGGSVYTLGIIFYAWKRLPFNHAIWHLMVLAGGMCHYFAIFLYLLPA